MCVHVVYIYIYMGEGWGRGVMYENECIGMTVFTPYICNSDILIVSGQCCFASTETV